MKKFLSVMLSFVILLGIVGCSDKIAEVDREAMSATISNAQYIPEPKSIFHSDDTATAKNLYVAAVNSQNIIKEGETVEPPKEGETVEPPKGGVTVEPPKEGVTVEPPKEDETTQPSSFDIFTFEKMINNLAVLDGVAAGKYLGYDVFEIKSELYNIVNRAPWMNEWFRVPRPREGIDNYSNWAYLIENDLDNNFLSVTRVSWRTRASYYDPNTGLEVEDYEGGSCVQYNVMRTKFYMDENTEIVEASMYNVMIAHGEHKTVSYQYLKNAKNKYFIKYFIEVMPRTDKGYVDLNKPYGSSSKFTYMTYDRNANFTLLDVNNFKNNLPTRPDNDYFTTILSIDRQNGGVRNNQNLTYGINVGNIDLSDMAKDYDVDMAKNDLKLVAEMAYKLDLPKSNVDKHIADATEVGSVSAAAQLLEDIIDDLTMSIVDNNYLKNNWQTIYKDSEDAKEEIRAEVPLPIKVKYSQTYADIEEKIVVNAEAYLQPNPAFRNMTKCDYYLGFGLLDTKGNMHFVDSNIGASNDFDMNFDIMWYGTWLKLNAAYSLADLISFDKGEYVLAVGLRKEGVKESLKNIWILDRSQGESVIYSANDKTISINAEEGLIRVSITDNIEDMN